MTSTERGPEWQGDDSFGPGWGNQTTHEPRMADEAAGESFGRDAKAGDLTSGGAGYGAIPAGSGFAIRDAGWHGEVEKIRPHMEVLGSDGGHVGTVDALRGEHIILARGDPGADGAHHGIPAGWVAKVDDKVRLNLTAPEARTQWRVEGRSRALFEREASGSQGPHILGRSFSGTYPDEKK
jgi:hypothetical protein